MQRIAISDLSESVRSFLAQVRSGDGIIVVDEAGCAQYGIVPYVEATPKEKSAAWEKLQRLQQNAQTAMIAAEVSSNEIEQLITDGD